MSKKDVFREDGRPRNGGLLGPVVDYYAVRANTMQCPYCRQRVNKDAVKCGACHEWLVDPAEAPAIAARIKDQDAARRRQTMILWCAGIGVLLLMAILKSH